MSCNSFVDCLGNPISGLPAESTFQNLTTTTYFFINLSYYIFYALLVIFIVYFLFKTIYSLFSAADESENYERFRAGITNAVFAAFGLALLFGAKFIINMILILLGVAEADNPFL